MGDTQLWTITISCQEKMLQIINFGIFRFLTYQNFLIVLSHLTSKHTFDDIF